MTGIGRRIKDARNRIGISQKELADRLGLTSKSTICKIETGDDNLTVDTIEKYAKALNVSVYYLMGKEDLEDFSQNANTATISKRLKDIMALRGIGQSELVKKTGINKGSLSSYLSGRYLPKQENVLKIAKALEVNPEWIMGCDVPMENVSVGSLFSDLEELENAMGLYNEFKNLTLENQIAIRTLLKSLQTNDKSLFK